MNALIAANLTFQQIEREAERISEAYGFAADGGGVRALAESIGGRVHVLVDADIKELQGGSLRVVGPEDFDIYLSPITSYTRDNFTIAHELGHYFLHSGSPPGSLRIRAGRWGKSLAEQQANRFAAALLMPRKKFLQVADRVENNTTVLAGRFKVSEEAAKIRLSVLGR